MDRVQLHRLSFVGAPAVNLKQYEGIEKDYTQHFCRGFSPVQLLWKSYRLPGKGYGDLGVKALM